MEIFIHLNLHLKNMVPLFVFKIIKKIPELWGCPPGYYILGINCYKMIREAKMFADAELTCQKEGGMLAKPVTLLQV